MTGWTKPSIAACSACRSSFASAAWASAAEPRRLGLETAAIDRVAQKRMADMRQMHADLMRAAGFQAAAQQARDRLAVAAGKTSRDVPNASSPPGRRRATTAIFSRSTLVAAERRIDRPARPRPARPRQRPDIRASAHPAAVVGEELGEPPVRGVGLGDDDKAGGILVEPMDDARPLHPADAGRLSPQWAISALTSVPLAWPGAGWTTSPAGLSMTIRCASS